MCRGRLGQRGKLRRRIHPAKFPVRVVRDGLRPLLHRLGLGQQFRLIVFGQAVMASAHVNPRINGGGTGRADLLLHHGPHLFHVVPVFRRFDPLAFQPQFPHAVFSVLYHY